MERKGYHLTALGLGLCCLAGGVVAATITAFDPPQLKVKVAAGSVVFPDQSAVTFAAETLSIDPAEVRTGSNLYYYNGSSAMRGTSTTALCPDNKAPLATVARPGQTGHLCAYTNNHQR
jgi:hypothetical protein